MNDRRRIRKRRGENGSAVLEGIFGICFLLFVFFCLLQIFQWCGRQMISDYASFYGDKAQALGYAGENCRKAARVAAIGMSGNDISTTFRVPLSLSSIGMLRRQAERYMRQGEGSGVEYEYWSTSHVRNRVLQINLSPYGEAVRTRIRLDDAPLIVPAMGRLIGLANQSGRTPDAASEVAMFNHARVFLDE